MPPPLLSFKEPGKSTDAGWASRWDNLRVAALCIGIKAYPGGAALGTTVKDAEIICEQINMLDRCRAATLIDPKSRRDIYEAARKQFLEPVSRNPPEMVIIFYAGHGMGIGHDLFLMPTLAKYEDADDRKETCISHLEVLTWLKTYVDAPAMQLAYASPRPAVRFLLIMDMCRDNFGSDLAHGGYDPAQQAAPAFWSMCLSTSRGAVASDGDSQHSPFVQELLDPTHGIFASCVPLKHGIENACARIREKMTQQPVTIALERVPPDFCLDRTPQFFDLSPSSSAAAGSQGNKRFRGGEGDMDDASEVGSANIPKLIPAAKRNLGSSIIRNEIVAKTIPAVNAVEDVELRLCVVDAQGQETEVVTWVQVDDIDLSAHVGLTALPDALRDLTALRALTVDCTALKKLPEWLGELLGLEELSLTVHMFFVKCPLQALPASVGTLTGLTYLNMTGCVALTVLPESIVALSGLTRLNLTQCWALTALPASLGEMSGLKRLCLPCCKALTALPASLGALAALESLDLTQCESLTALPQSIGVLTGLTRLVLVYCTGLTALPASLSALSRLEHLKFDGCSALQTPPQSIVRHGKDEVFQFLRDLAKGEAPSHLIKVVLLGDQRAGKSSLADSLVLGRPATRSDNDRTVGIEVRRWWLGGQEIIKEKVQVVANIYDAAGHRVYRATHGFFMSPGALFLHVVRCNMAEHTAVAVLLEWIEAVQQEAPGANMGIIWTHIDCVENATAMQARVLEQLHTEIEQQVQAVGEVLQHLEDEYMHDLDVKQQTDLPAQWVRARQHRDATLAILDQVSMPGCCQNTYIKVTEMESSLHMLKRHHFDMCLIEDQMAAGTPDMDRSLLAAQLKKLRTQRMQRPRILCSHGVSSLTGQGLHVLQIALARLMMDSRLFESVGKKVPLNYSMLERLAHEGRMQARGGAEHDSEVTEAGRADWEQAVTQHVLERASAGLREVCSQACVSLGDLEEAAAKIGMDKAEVRSALLFLHGTGSVLHYGSDTWSRTLQDTVFMQPQFIIDAMKCIIRERSATDVNDEVRTMDARVRQNSYDAEMLDRFLGTDKIHGSGVLTRQLLTRYLWGHLNSRQHALLLELMKAFRLLRPLANHDTFLVPAMMPQRPLPDEYVTPHWWRPSKATAATVAIMHVEDVERRAEMCMMYKVLGGRLPLGFMSELQVRLAQSDCVDQDEELHFVAETAVVDRVSGSVLSVAYTCGGGTVREWAILSQAHSGEAATGEASNCLRIMGWAELSSCLGATDWRLFQRILKVIEGMAHSAPGLSLRKMALYVDRRRQCGCGCGSGELAKPLEITQRNTKRQVFSLVFEDGKKMDVCHDIFLPSFTETRLSRHKQLLNPSASQSTWHWVDAFFAKRIDDNHFDVHAEGQVMQRIVLNPGCGWEYSMNLEPTIEDLYSSIESARQRNVRVLHLAGHGREKCSFIWNASDSATARREFDVDAICLAIGSVAGKKGPMECVVLNACSTEKMGRLLLQQGVPYVICWRTPVQDETAKEVCERFYRALVENTSGLRNYQLAFLAATDGFLSSAHTSGAAQRLRGALASDGCHSKTVLSGNIRSNTTSSCSPAEGGSSQRGSVPWLQIDVILFLSQDCESVSIHLWREKPVMSSTVTPSAHITGELSAEDPVDAALKALFEKHELGALGADVCRELGVHVVGDLAHVTPEDLEDLPKYLKDKLKPVQKRKLTAMLASQLFLPVSALGELGSSQPSAAAAGTSAGST